MTISPEQFRDEIESYRFQDPLAKTEEERLEKKRFEAGFAFELNHPPARRSALR
jgi:hypothetical protein